MPKIEITGQCLDALKVLAKREGRSATKQLDCILKRSLGCTENAPDGHTLKPSDGNSTVDEGNLPISEVKRRVDLGEWTDQQARDYFSRIGPPGASLGEPERTVIGRF
jgi:hypothetical protein